MLFRSELQFAVPQSRAPAAELSAEADSGTLKRAPHGFSSLIVGRRPSRQTWTHSARTAARRMLWPCRVVRRKSLRSLKHGARRPSHRGGSGAVGCGHARGRARRYGSYGSALGLLEGLCRPGGDASGKWRVLDDRGPAVSWHAAGVVRTRSAQLRRGGGDYPRVARLLIAAGKRFDLMPEPPKRRLRPRLAALQFLQRLCRPTLHLEDNSAPG